ncbi:MAG TPA: SIMPL domain-containing protein [Silvibacterium sp.]|nr:SIMPL domain-containing protein [Silvibacterium sp.]
MKSNIRHGLLIPAIFAAAALAASAQTIQVNQNNRTIAVTVTDKATAEADIATVHIGFETYAPTSDAAYAAGSRTSNAIIDALHKSGVPDKIIESAGQGLRRTEFDDSDKESAADRAKKQFTLTQSWTVKCSATEAAKVLHTAIEAGANTSGQVDWDLGDRSGLQAQAATKALQHARAVADQMAQGLNAHLGLLIYASNQVPSLGVFSRLETFSKLQSMNGANVLAPLALNPQKIEESATVYAVFAIQ